MRHEYPRGLRGPLAEDLVLVGAWVAFAVLVDLPAGVRGAMLAAIPIVIGWGIVTLHFPARVEIGEEGVAFGGYGRVHRFAWRDVERVRVRRFLVKDRVLVRIEPSGGAWRGRYWIRETMGGFGGVVGELERRGSVAGSAAGSGTGSGTGSGSGSAAGSGSVAA
jgi:hypothetical protein